MRVILGLLLWSLIEIGLFATVGGAIGLFATWAVVIGTGFLGLAILRGAGPKRMVGVRTVDLGGPLARGILRGLAGVLLMLPGFLTDAIGLLLLIPAVQGAVLAHLKRRFAGKFTVSRGFGGAHRDDPIEGEAIEIEPERLEKPSGWTKP